MVEIQPCVQHIVVTLNCCSTGCTHMCHAAYMPELCLFGRPLLMQHTFTDTAASFPNLVEDFCDVTTSTTSVACVGRALDTLRAADRIAYPLPVTVWARSARELVTAMVNSTVDLVIITQDLCDWSDAQPLLDSMQLPVLRSRNITIQGAALPGVYPVLDFRFVKPFLM